MISLIKHVSGTRKPTAFITGDTTGSVFLNVSTDAAKRPKGRAIAFIGRALAAAGDFAMVVLMLSPALIVMAALGWLMMTF